MTEVVALGELLIDFACLSQDGDGYPVMAAHPGGAPANFLGALTAYGVKTALLGKVGADTFGNLLLGTLQKAGIGTRGMVQTDEVFTTLAFVTFDETGDRKFAFSRKPGADTCLKPEELDWDLIGEAKAFHFGTLSLTDDPARTATQKAVDFAKEQGKLITFDPNLRKPLWRDLGEAKEQMLWGLEQADFVKISDEEVEFLWDCGPEEGVEKLLKEFGVSLALVTCGAKGAWLANEGSAVFVPCPRVEPVDTTGAGDICGGSALSRILRIGKELSQLSREELTGIAAFAVTAASLSTEKSGGIPSIPTQEQVLERLST